MRQCLGQVFCVSRHRITTKNNTEASPKVDAKAMTTRRVCKSDARQNHCACKQHQVMTPHKKYVKNRYVGMKILTKETGWEEEQVCTSKHDVFTFETQNASIRNAKGRAMSRLSPQEPQKWQPRTLKNEPETMLGRPQETTLSSNQLEACQK